MNKWRLLLLSVLSLLQSASAERNFVDGRDRSDIKLSNRGPYRIYKSSHGPVQLNAPDNLYYEVRDAELARAPAVRHFKHRELHWRSPLVQNNERLLTDHRTAIEEEIFRVHAQSNRREYRQRTNEYEATRGDINRNRIVKQNEDRDYPDNSRPSSRHGNSKEKRVTRLNIAEAEQHNENKIESNSRDRKVYNRRIEARIDVRHGRELDEIRFVRRDFIQKPREPEFRRQVARQFESKNSFEKLNRANLEYENTQEMEASRSNIQRQHARSYGAAHGRARTELRRSSMVSDTNIRAASNSKSRDNLNKISEIVIDERRKLNLVRRTPKSSRENIRDNSLWDGSRNMCTEDLNINLRQCSSRNLCIEERVRGVHNAGNNQNERLTTTRRFNELAEFIIEKDTRPNRPQMLYKRQRVINEFRRTKNVREARALNENRDSRNGREERSINEIRDSRNTREERATNEIRHTNNAREQRAAYQIQRKYDNRDDISRILYSEIRETNGLQNTRNIQKRILTGQRQLSLTKERQQSMQTLFDKRSTEEANDMPRNRYQSLATRETQKREHHNVRITRDDRFNTRSLESSKRQYSTSRLYDTERFSKNTERTRQNGLRKSDAEERVANDIRNNRKIREENLQNMQIVIPLNRDRRTLTHKAYLNVRYTENTPEVRLDKSRILYTGERTANELQRARYLPEAKLLNTRRVMPLARDSISELNMNTRTTDYSEGDHQQRSRSSSAVETNEFQYIKNTREGGLENRSKRSPITRKVRAANEYHNTGEERQTNDIRQIRNIRDETAKNEIPPNRIAGEEKEIYDTRLTRYNREKRATNQIRHSNNVLEERESNEIRHARGIREERTNEIRHTRNAREVRVTTEMRPTRNAREEIATNEIRLTQNAREEGATNEIRLTRNAREVATNKIRLTRNAHEEKGTNEIRLTRNAREERVTNEIRLTRNAREERATNKIRFTRNAREERATNEIRLTRNAREERATNEIRLARSARKEKATNGIRVTRNVREERATNEIRLTRNTREERGTNDIRLTRNAREERATNEIRLTRNAREERGINEIRLTQIAREDGATNEIRLTRNAREVAKNNIRLTRNAQEEKRTNEIRVIRNAREEIATDEIRLTRNAREERAKNEIRLTRNAREERATNEIRLNRNALEERATNEIRLTRNAREKRATNEIRLTRNAREVAKNNIRLTRNAHEEKGTNKIRFTRNVLEERATNEIRLTRNAREERATNEIRLNRNALEERATNEIRLTRNAREERATNEIRLTRNAREVAKNNIRLTRNAHEEKGTNEIRVIRNAREEIVTDEIRLTRNAREERAKNEIRLTRNAREERATNEIRLTRNAREERATNEIRLTRNSREEKATNEITFTRNAREDELTNEIRRARNARDERTNEIQRSRNTRETRTVRHNHNNQEERASNEIARSRKSPEQRLLNTRRAIVSARDHNIQNRITRSMPLVREEKRTMVQLTASPVAALNTEMESTLVSKWQYIIYLLQGIYLCSLFMKMPKGYGEFKKTRAADWFSTMDYLKID